MSSKKKIPLFQGLQEGSVAYYKCSGLVSSVLHEITSYDQREFQMYVNQMGFEMLHETAIECVKAVEAEEKSWNFLLNGQYLKNKIYL